MASVIKIKRSTTPGSAPSSLAAGEIAVNIPDRLLFVGDGSSIYRIGAQYLAVANAAATYQTKTVERAALANTNAFIKSQLANTNAFIKSQLANTNLYIATKVNTTTFNSALANTNSWIKSQLANTNTYIATKVDTTTFNSALANTNTYIATKVNTTTFNSALANTNTYIATKLNSNNPAVTGTLSANGSTGSAGYFLRSTGSGIYWDALPPPSKYLEVANAVATYAVKSNPSTSGFFNHTGRLTVGTNLAVSGNTRISGSTIIDGDLTVEGAVVYISSSTLNVDDSLIKLSSNNAADVVDTGFYSKYVVSSTPKYAGVFRDATDGIFKVFADSQSEPGTTVNVSATGYTLAQLDAIIDGGTY
jgi:hypothetical protein